MRVLNVNLSIAIHIGGGIGERSFQVSRHLVKAGVDCSILTTDLGLTAERRAALEGVEVNALPCLIKRFFVPRVSFGLLREIVGNADVVQLEGHWTPLNALVYRTCKKLNKPYVVCPAGTLPLFGRSKLVKKLYNAVVGNRIIRDARALIAIPAEEAKQFRAYGVEADRVCVIPNGVNPEEYLDDDVGAFRLKHSLGNAPIVLFMGRLNPIKGPDLLLEAFCAIHQRFPDHQLVFVGPDGGLLDELKQRAKREGIEDRVRFLGFVGKTERSRAYHAAELLVIPSRLEAMSIVVLEAGVTGTPVLLTDTCGMDQVGTLGGGMVVGASATELQRGLTTLLDDRTRFRQMGRVLKAYTLENYTWPSIIHKYIELFEKVLKSGPSSTS